jgi:hypothetical protein
MTFLNQPFLAVHATSAMATAQSTLDVALALVTLTAQGYALLQHRRVVTRACTLGFGVPFPERLLEFRHKRQT